MTNKEILNCISTALEMPEDSVTMESTMDNVHNWDSFGHLGILVALDEKFGGKVASIDEMASADSITKIFDLLESNKLL